VWALSQFFVISNATDRTLYVLLITAFLPLAAKFLNESEVLGIRKNREAGSNQRPFPCSNCATIFLAVPYDDSHPIASRTKGEYKDQVPLTYKCKKCQTANIIYWSAREYGPVGARRQSA
jgi:endogenous inhibitor of DNA gyrase (YacG/DUF329 family)